MSTTANEYTTETQTINGVEVTVYGGTARPIRAYALAGHVTGWRRREGARTTYAELTCTCNLHGEAVNFPSEKGFLSYDEDGWVDQLNAVALAHIENAIANAFMMRPKGGDRSRWADRRRINSDELFRELQVHGVRYSEVMPIIDDIKAGHVITTDDGTRFELARDRNRYAVEGALPIY